MRKERKCSMFGLAGRATLAVAVIGLLGLPASATPLYEQEPVVYDSGTSSDNIVDSYEDPLLGPSYYADAFNIGEAGELDRVITSLEWWGVETDEPLYNIRFFDEENGQPGSTIASFTDTVANPTSNGWDHFAWTLPGEGLRISADTNYFLSIAADADLFAVPPESFAWSHSSPNGSGSSWLTFDGADWTDAGTPQNLAFRLDGHVVPEPATMTLLGIGVAGLGIRRWRRNRG